MAVVVGEGGLHAGVWSLATDDHPCTFRPAVQIEQLGGLGDLAVLTGRRILVLDLTTTLASVMGLFQSARV
jgi:hypothetical protein